jgi:hypothetical protein
MPCSNEPAETFVRADGAFIPFAHDFDINTVTTTVRGVGDIGDVKVIDLQCPLNRLIGRQVCKIGRSSGHTTGTVSLFVWLVADGWCWFVLREKYCWLVGGGWFVLR